MSAQAWVVVTPEGGMLFDTVRSHRSFAIRTYVSSRGILWPDARRSRGVRCVRCTLTTEGDA